ncbi:V-type proton ATPase subunit E-like [Bolinopsis microptera]|uniref:V-type proton ATPase subunit E-like n=1 Tax=Bolinopsis microptera TaxID=2820187 RepID=UPI00307A48C2
MAIPDTEVERQIQQMIQFIDHEADEKEVEILAKADEEFNIEKGRLVEQEKQKIRSFYEKKEKNAELQKKIQLSNLQNQARLKLLKQREDHLDEVVVNTTEKLRSMTSDIGKYQNMLQGLITQGLCQLLEPNVLIQCRQKDLQLVKEVLDKALKRYTELSKLDVVIKVDEKTFLASDIAGGVQLSARDGKLLVTNTLEARLDQIVKQKIPEVRTMLYGNNPNRRFFD